MNKIYYYSHINFELLLYFVWIVHYFVWIKIWIIIVLLIFALIFWFLYFFHNIPECQCWSFIFSVWRQWFLLFDIFHNPFRHGCACCCCCYCCLFVRKERLPWCWLLKAIRVLTLLKCCSMLQLKWMIKTKTWVDMFVLIKFIVDFVVFFKGNSALLLACQCQFPSTAVLLIAAGAEVHIQSLSHSSMLQHLSWCDVMWLAGWWGSSEIVESWRRQNWVAWCYGCL